MFEEVFLGFRLIGNDIIKMRKQYCTLQNLKKIQPYISTVQKKYHVSHKCSFKVSSNHIKMEQVKLMLTYILLNPIYSK